MATFVAHVSDAHSEKHVHRRASIERTRTSPRAPCSSRRVLTKVRLWKALAGEFVSHNDARSRQQRFPVTCALLHRTCGVVPPLLLGVDSIQ